MKISVEISMYPLTSDYEAPILAFIDELKKESSLLIRTNGMSTQVFGEFDILMPLLQDAYKKTISEQKKVIFVQKLLGADASNYQPK